MSELYRGTIAYDKPLRADAGSGKLDYKEYYKRWRAAHREELRVYNREYQRKWRKKQVGASFDE